MIRTTGKSGCSCFALRCGRKYIHWNRVVYICSIKFIIRNVHQNVSHLLSWSLGRGRRWGIGTGVFFGMLVAISVGIVFVPFFFVWIYRIKAKLKKR